MTNTETTYSKSTDSDGIVTVVLDDPDSKVNTMNDHFKDAFEGIVDWLEANVDDITGVVLTSAKKTFFAGGTSTSCAQPALRTRKPKPH